MVCESCCVEQSKPRKREPFGRRRQQRSPSAMRAASFPCTLPVISSAAAGVFWISTDEYHLSLAHHMYICIHFVLVQTPDTRRVWEQNSSRFISKLTCITPVHRERNTLRQHKCTEIGQCTSDSRSASSFQRGHQDLQQNTKTVMTWQGLCSSARCCYSQFCERISYVLEYFLSSSTSGVQGFLVIMVYDYDKLATMIKRTVK